MAKVKEKMKDFIMSFTIQEQKKKELKEYRQEIEKLKNLTEDEIDLLYINLKSKYEHKKNILSIFLLTIVISVIMEVWKYFYGFIESFIKYTSLKQGADVETAKIVFVVMTIMIVLIIIVFLGMLVMHTKKMKSVYKDLIMVEEIRNKRNK